jgi:hypothetical protein
MPSLQVLLFYVPKMAVTDPRYYDDIGLEYLSWLQKITVIIHLGSSEDNKNRVEAALRRAAQVHPNSPKFGLGVDL